MVLKRLLNLHIFSSKKNKRLIYTIKSIVGYKPLNLSIYKLVTQHSSIAKENAQGFKESNERLEYLGDAILGAIIAEYLFKKYPYKNEGFLTEIRSRIVNRESLNQLALKIGLNKLIEYNQKPQRHSMSFKSIYGDSLEALVGAVYLDRGYKKCKKFVINKLLLPHYDLDEIIKKNPNHKSQLIEWAHQEQKEVKFEIVQVKNSSPYKEFVAEVVVEGEAVSRGTGLSKKKAEQSAAEKALEKLKVIG
ncbi:ribonuclease III [Aureibacter tunicatorum]|uniref:ribonuclease III n=1 Tax=Aureibacter tunicatorum TaxID=866807 RepID=UPI00286C7373|nr:ribonuclease III [Aureibacter tunicatorum]